MSETNQIVRLVYASRATFKPFGSASSKDGSIVKIDENIANILETSRKENIKYQVFGVLFYGQGYFFQCLEGSQGSIDRLYAKLLQDSRHTDLKILATHAIDKLGFSGWEMKFATIDQEVRSFLKSHNMARFNPYKFDPAMTDTLVELLHNVNVADKS
jgi:hypothetical protein